MKTLFKIWFVCLVAFQAKAQDIHFSQFNSSPLNINPAFTGLFKGDYRFVGNHRDQWSAITIPYLTLSASADMNFRTSEKAKDLMGFGVNVNRDKAGDSEYGTTQLNTSLSYTKEIQTDFFLSYGMQAGIAQRAVNFQNLTFDSQYNGDKFDKNINNGENFIKDSFTFWDASTGVNFFYSPESKYDINLGFSAYHINRPIQSFTNDGEIRLRPRFSIHSSSQFKIFNNIVLQPGALYLSQGSFKEITAGSYVKFFLKAKPDEIRALYLGSWFRLKDKDAIILTTRFDYNKLNVGLSYDINMSRLSDASNYKGGVELSIIYIIEKIRLIRSKKIPCPTFI